MAKEALPFLMFEGAAEEAMEFYVTLFPGSEIVSIERYGPGEPGPEGTVKAGRFRIVGQDVRCFDSHIKHAFTFTPAFSIFVTCETEAELNDAFARLSAGGGVLMPLNNYGFSKKFGWVNDRFGVSWQLNLEA